MVPTGTYTHSEHLSALRVQISAEPLKVWESTTIDLLSRGDSFEDIAKAAEVQIQSIKIWHRHAVEKLCATNAESAYYNLLALGQSKEDQILSDEEHQALKLMASGKDNEQIAEAFGHTYKSRRNRGSEITRRVREKLNASSNVEAIRIGYHLRLLDPKRGNPPLAPWPT